MTIRPLILTIVMTTLASACKPMKGSKKTEGSSADDRQCTLGTQENFQLSENGLASVGSLQAIYQEAGFDAIRDICEASLGIYFIGNGERLGDVVWSPHASPAHRKAFEKRQEERDSLFFESIETGYKDLAGVLNRNDCEPMYIKHGPKNLEDFYDKNSVYLVQIIDGPGQGDSRISLEHYSWSQKGEEMVWSSKLSQYLWQKEAGLQRSKRSFELNIPRDLISILNAKFQVNSMQSETLSEVVDRNFYIFKTHGGLLVNSLKEKPDILNFEKRSNQNSVPIMFFDPTSDDGKAHSNLYAPIWFRKTACAIYSQANRREMFKREQCDQSVEADALSVPLTSGVDGTSCNTAGSAKSSLFNMKTQQPLLKNSASDLRPTALDGYLKLGAGMTYLSQGSTGFKIQDGVYELESIPFGKSRANSLLMDSCYGSEEIGIAFQHSGDNVEARNVAIFNSNPLYFDLVQYGEIDLGQYLALTLLLDPPPQYRESLGKLSQTVKDRLKSGGFGDQSAGGISQFRTLDVSIRRENSGVFKKKIASCSDGETGIFFFKNVDDDNYSVSLEPLPAPLQKGDFSEFTASSPTSSKEGICEAKVFQLTQLIFQKEAPEHPGSPSRLKQLPEAPTGTLTVTYGEPSCSGIRVSMDQEKFTYHATKNLRVKEPDQPTLGTNEAPINVTESKPCEIDGSKL